MFLNFSIINVNLIVSKILYHDVKINIPYLMLFVSLNKI